MSNNLQTFEKLYNMCHKLSHKKLVAITTIESIAEKYINSHDAVLQKLENSRNLRDEQIREILVYLKDLEIPTDLLEINCWNYYHNEDEDFANEIS